MLEILLYVSSGLIICSYIGYVLMVILGRAKTVSNSSSFDVTKDIISEYNSINVIESRSYFTVYNIKRRVIKLASSCYYGKDLSSISLALMEAGISIIDNNKNKYINIFKNIFSNLKLLYIFPLIALIVNNVTYSISDAKIGLVLVGIFSVITYILVDIKNLSCEWIINNLKKIKDINKNNNLEIVGFMNKLLWFDKFIFFGELMMIIRFVGILLQI